jgi:hypothetical protein
MGGDLYELFQCGQGGEGGHNRTSVLALVEILNWYVGPPLIRDDPPIIIS